MINSSDIAIVGATGLVGESLVALLEESDFPLGRLHLLAGPDSAGARVEFRGGYVTVRELAGFDFSQVQVAIFATGSQVAAEFAPRAAAAGCVVVDTSTRFRTDPDVPLVIPEVNPAAIAGYRKRRLLASPDSAVVLLLLALRPIHAAVGIERLAVTALRAVSGRGRDAVEELASQSAALLNAMPTESHIFPKQVAFNCLADVDETLDNGYIKQEMQLLSDVRRTLADETLAASFTCVTVPVFFGDSLDVSIITRKPLAATDARRLLETAPGLQITDHGRERGSAPSPVDSAEQDGVFVGRIRKDLDEPKGLHLWVVGDNVRRGVALNALRIAEILVKEYL